MEKKEARGVILYVRISASNNDWVEREAARLGYSKSEFMDLTLQEIREKAADARQKKAVPQNRK